MNAAEMIKNYRTTYGLSQAKLGKRLNVTQGLVGHWEKSRRPIGVTMALLIEHITNGELTARDLRPDLPWPPWQPPNSPPA